MDADHPRLCLVLGPLTSPVAPHDVADVLSVLDAATLVLDVETPHGVDVATLTPLVKAAQTKGIAVLIATSIEIAEQVGADGVHVPWCKSLLAAFEAARKAMGPRRIVGADAGRSRHDAMEIGEAGADYVAFGIPPHVDDRVTALERQINLVAWWVELFEVPVVAFDARTPEDVSALARAGADFIAVTWPAGEARPMAWAEALKASLAPVA